MFVKKFNYILRIFPFCVVHTVSMMRKRFILCGLVGWCLEIFWTGLKSLQRRQLKLMGHSSIWMFPIYGMAFLFAPISRLLRKKSVWVRGSVYAGGIFLTEYLSGMFLKKRGICPWDYTGRMLSVDGLIRLDFAPFWFGTGLLFEYLTGSFRDSLGVKNASSYR